MTDTSRLYQVVDPIPSRAPRLGLVQSATLIDESDPHWEQGIAWTPEACGEDGGVFDYCSDAGITYGSVPEAGQFIPVGIYAAVECSTMSHLDIPGRARRSLELQESRLIEKELADGALAVAKGYPNRRLADDALVSKPVGATATAAVRALSILEQELAECNSGGRGYIHAMPNTVTYWQHHNLLRREGNLLLTALDTIVVPGAGYSGKSPTGAAPPDYATSWAYATGAVEIRRGPVQTLSSEVITKDVGGRQNEQNLSRSVAYRMVAVTFDPCCHIGINVKNCTLQDC